MILSWLVTASIDNLLISNSNSASKLIDTICWIAMVQDEYFQVDNSAIKHDGFFVNRGKLERV